jgi:hypothetical protein
MSNNEGGAIRGTIRHRNNYSSLRSRPWLDSLTVRRGSVHDLDFIVMATCELAPSTTVSADEPTAAPPHDPVDGLALSDR